MNLRKIDKKEYDKTRKLWEEIFTDDSVSFLDYYYTYKTKDNEIYGIEEGEELCSMLQLNPYLIKLGSHDYPCNYIIAVATKPEYRHQGMMKKLLSYSLHEMYERREPFVYLMPAAESIYTPFDFRYIYRQKNEKLDLGWYQEDKSASSSQVMIERLSKDLSKLQEVAEFAENYLQERYQVYARRDRGYYEVLQKELESEDGDILILRDYGEIVGVIPYGVGEKVEVREPMLEPVYEKIFYYILDKEFASYEKAIQITSTIFSAPKDRIEEKPIIMARLVNLESFVKEVQGEEPLEFTLGVEDPILQENTGIYQWKIGQEGSSIKKVDDKKNVISLGIHIWVSIFFGYEPIEDILKREQIQLEPQLIEVLKRIKPFRKIALNEVV